MVSRQGERESGTTTSSGMGGMCGNKILKSGSSDIPLKV